MSTTTTTKPRLRISQAALGRRLASVLLLAREGQLSSEEVLATMDAVYESCMDGDYRPDPEADVNTEVYEAERAEIEKSVRRSEAARRRYRERREKSRENLLSHLQVTEPAPTVTAIVSDPCPAPPSPRSRKKDRARKRRLRNGL